MPCLTVSDAFMLRSAGLDALVRLRVAGGWGGVSNLWPAC